jgi:hypothetical protein
VNATDLLVDVLRVAVPLRIDEANRKSPALRTHMLHAWRVNAVDAVAYRGDQLLFASKPHKGEGGTADTFNHLARGLAALAFQPGGVRFGGLIWCARHAPAGAVSDQHACGRCGDEEPRPTTRPRPARIEVVQLPDEGDAA